jgi:hypothetical protein
MMDRSPLAVATAVAAPAATPNFAKDLYVANAHSRRTRHRTSRARTRFQISYDDQAGTVTPLPTSSGGKNGATKVTISKGQTATLAFNGRSKTTAAAAQVPQQQMQVQPQQIWQPNAVVRSGVFFRDNGRRRS